MTALLLIGAGLLWVGTVLCLIRAGGREDARLSVLHHTSAPEPEEAPDAPDTPRRKSA